MWSTYTVYTIKCDSDMVCYVCICGVCILYTQLSVTVTVTIRWPPPEGRLGLGASNVEQWC